MNGKVRERKKRQLMGRGLSVRILVRRECKRLALRNSRKMAKTVLYNEILREGSSKEWKWKGERNVCFVIERCG